MSGDLKAFRRSYAYMGLTAGDSSNEVHTPDS
jgi:hypothetical protein